ncbi:sensor histidine kinase [Parafrankia sp. FMc2]|uniref:sensor histidine kinase n=1 Tax=Parafrankia sp. FMc2 TaxID=3233196 RepID=UPI0034D45383
MDPSVADPPAQVLALAATPPPGTRSGGGALSRIAALVGQASQARQVIIRRIDATGPAVGPAECVWPANPPATGQASAVRVSRVVRHRGAQVAELSVELPAAGTPEQRASAAAAVEAVAAVLGGVLAADALTNELRAARARSRAASERIADERHRAASQLEQQRQDLERDLHDGAQLHLVSLQMACAVLDHQLATAPADPRSRAEAVADLGTRLRHTRRLLAETAAGVAPAPLRTAGLAGALAAGLRGTRDVTLDVAAGVRARRYPHEVENALYLACMEAVSNAQKHAPGTPVRVEVRDTYHGLSFTVADEGPGLGGSAGATLGSLRSLRSRLASVGGTLVVRSQPGRGTAVTGTVPI